MKTRRLYLSAFFLFCSACVALDLLQVVYIGMAEIFGEGGFHPVVVANLIRHLFVFSGLSVVFGWEAVLAHFESRETRGLPAKRWQVRAGASLGIFLSLGGVLWAAAFAGVTWKTWKVLGPWAAGPDAFFLLLGLGGIYYFMNLSIAGFRAAKEMK